jgi:transcriptional regulator with XRE-family HTH domain
MKTNKEATKYSSSLLKSRLANIDPLTRETIRTKMHIAARIDDLRESKGWSKSLLAEKLGKQPSEITKWLSGNHNFTIEVLVKIAYILGEKVSSLLIDPSTQQYAQHYSLDIHFDEDNIPAYAGSDVQNHHVHTSSASVSDMPEIDSLEVSQQKTKYEEEILPDNGDMNTTFAIAA